VNINLGTGAVSGGDAAGDTIANFENLIGSGGDDTLTGSSGANSISGGAGDDLIFGNGGADSIDGGSNASDNLLTAGNRGDVMVVSGTVDFTALGDNYQNLETISMKNADGSSGNSTLTLNSTDVLGMADSGTANPTNSGYGTDPAIRVDGDAGDHLNLVSGVTDNWVLGAGNGTNGVPAGYDLYVHVTSGTNPTVNDDAYVLVQTTITVATS
jgi:hypothetical protein